MCTRSTTLATTGLFLAAATLLCGACGDVSPVSEPDAAPDAVDLDNFTESELAQISGLSPLPALPPDPTNAYADHPGAARLGQMLFFDKSYSGALLVGDDGSNGGLGPVGALGKVSCHTCHAVGSATLDDQRATNHISLGTNFGTRNALGMVNSSFYEWTNWGGRFDSQWSLPLAVSENAALMRSSRLQIAHMMFEKYSTEYNAIFPTPLDPALDFTANDAARFPYYGKPKAAGEPDGPWEMMTAADREIVMRIWVNYGKALAAYTRTLVSRNAPFDRYVAGDKNAISDSAKRGLRTFLAECTSCHAGPHMTDDDFHVLGVPQTGSGVPASDLGRYQDIPALLASPLNTDGPYSDNRDTGKLAGLMQTDSQKGAFRTRSLRGIAASAPYMHAGQLATLADVVAFYNAGGGPVAEGMTKDPLMQPLNLTAQQQVDLVAFLETLTGEPVDPLRLVDISK